MHNLSGSFVCTENYEMFSWKPSAIKNNPLLNSLNHNFFNQYSVFGSVKYKYTNTINI